MGNTLTTWSGANIILFPNNGVPDIYGKAISIHPATETKIAVSKKVVQAKFFKEPYISKCTDVWDIGDMNIHNAQPYSHAHCFDARIQSLMYKKCKCLLSHGYMNGNLERDPSKIKWCGPQDEPCATQLAERWSGSKDMSQGRRICRPRCHEELFLVIVFFPFFKQKNFHE